jgi:hypothetical protein
MSRPLGGRFEEEGEAGVVDRRLGKPLPRGPLALGLDNGRNIPVDDLEQPHAPYDRRAY